MSLIMVIIMILAVQIFQKDGDATLKHSSSQLDTWTDEGTTLDDLYNELQKVSIDISYDGKIDMYFESIEIFGGHSINLKIDNDNKYTDVNLFG